MMFWMYMAIAFEAGFIAALIWEFIRREREEENRRKWEEYFRK